MAKPKSFSKSNKEKQIMIAKTHSATHAIGTLKKDTDLFILTYGQFSLTDALLVILDQTGPAHVSISTWTAANAHLERSARLMETADVLSFKLIVDTSFKARQPKYYNHMIELFGVESIRTMKTHAKFMVIKNDNWNIVVRTSMNLNGNPRLENIEISESENFASFFETIVLDIFKEVGIGEQKKDKLKLESLKELSLFKLIEAKHIERKTLKEANYTHEIKNNSGNINIK